MKTIDGLKEMSKNLKAKAASLDIAIDILEHGNNIEYAFEVLEKLGIKLYMKNEDTNS